jgi:hypothetical protein
MSKIEDFWENATADDVARVMKGETVEARFRGDSLDGWKESNLAGWSKLDPLDVAVWAGRGLGNHYRYCQVYREPSWFTNKPDPGLGYRLLEKFPDEELKPGDEYFDQATTRWRCSLNAKAGQPQPEKVWYRRRIESAPPKFAVGQTVRVIGPKEKPALHWGKEMDRQIGFAGVIRNNLLYEDGERFYNLEDIGIWCFREDYLEPVEAEPKHYVLRVGDKANISNGQTITITEKGFEVTQ